MKGAKVFDLKTGQVFDLKTGLFIWWLENLFWYYTSSAYTNSCLWQGPGRWSVKHSQKPDRWMNLSPWLDQVLLVLWETQRCALQMDVLRWWYIFFPDGSNATSQKTAQQGSSVTMIMISSREVKWVKVIATKRKCLVIRISFQFIMKWSCRI